MNIITAPAHYLSVLFASRRRSSLAAVLSLLLAAGLLLPSVHAQTATSAVPGLISYQGKVSNANGTLVGAGTPVNRTVTFRIWSHQSNSTVNDLVYSEQQTVTISEGEFSVLIGQGTAVSGTPLGYSETSKGPNTVTVGSLGVFGGATRYLGVTVDDGNAATADPEISPRQQLVSSAYAFRAKYAESVGSNGTSVLTVLDSGNVGVGSANPGAKLEVAGNIRAGGASVSNPSLQLLANSASTVASSVTYAASASQFSSDAAAGDTVFRTENGGKLLLQAGVGASALVVDASNKVGVGTAAPGAKLEVASSDSLNTAFISNTGGGGGTQPALRVKMAAASGARNVIQAENSSGSVFMVRDDGAVMLNSGIANNVARPAVGTARVPGEISAYSSSGTGNDDGFLRLSAGGGTNANTKSFIDLSGYSTVADMLENIRFGTAGAERMRIDISGKVGIGTTTPSTMLQIGQGTNAGPGGLLINTGWANPANTSENRPFEVQLRGTTAMVVNTDSKVGIGTATPGSALHVKGAGTTGGVTAAFDFSSGTNTSFIHYGSNGDIYWRSGTTSGHVMMQDTGGYVTIGGSTANKVGKLNVISTGNGLSGPYSYFNGNGQVGTGNSAGTYPSIYAQSAIVTGAEFNCMSDQRAKVITGLSDAASDLRTLMQIEITNYHYKDQIEKGTKAQKKVIGQQVGVVFPLAVNQITNTVPDIFAAATVQGEWVELATDLKPGERVKLVTDKKADVYDVLEVKPGSFRTAFKGESGKVFVYGREVNDFRVVDYEAIAMLNVSATQEIKREKDAEIAELKKRIAELEAKDRVRDAKFAAIEKLLRGNQAVMARPAKYSTVDGQE